MSHLNVEQESGTRILCRETTSRNHGKATALALVRGVSTWRWPSCWMWVKSGQKKGMRCHRAWQVTAGRTDRNMTWGSPAWHICNTGFDDEIATCVLYLVNLTFVLSMLTDPAGCCRKRLCRCGRWLGSRYWVSQSHGSIQSPWLLLFTLTKWSHWWALQSWGTRNT